MSDQFQQLLAVNLLFFGNKDYRPDMSLIIVIDRTGLYFTSIINYHFERILFAHLCQGNIEILLQGIGIKSHILHLLLDLALVFRIPA